MVKQTSLRNISIRTRGKKDHNLFVFPFFDRQLYVRFLLLVAENGYFLLQDRIARSKKGLLINQGFATKRPQELSGVGSEKFHRLYHFDPWWAMKDAELDPSIVDAIVATNLAGRESGHLIIRDLIFDESLESVNEVLVGDGVFRPVSYGQKGPMPLDLEESFFGLAGRPHRKL